MHHSSPRVSDTTGPALLAISLVDSTVPGSTVAGFCRSRCDYPTAVSSFKTSTRPPTSHLQIKVTIEQLLNFTSLVEQRAII
ncbi:hypothetical protein BKA80DRAFT_52934 [Phyllosticta citrichinensis]